MAFLSLVANHYFNPFHLIQRCSCLSSWPHVRETTCQAIKNLKESLDTDVPVLARRETDGYYYQGTIIKGIEGEMRKFLVQFTRPFAVGEEDIMSVQEIASADILECVTGMKHSIMPGDKVLAPWKPEQKRYGPGTVLQGMETRDPLREREDEKITVSFWNGKKTKVPLGVALWIPPHQWERIVEMIHMPHTTRKKLKGSSAGLAVMLGLIPYHLVHIHALRVTSEGFSGHNALIYVLILAASETHAHNVDIHNMLPAAPQVQEVLVAAPSAELAKEEFSSRPTTQLLAVEGSPKAESATAVSDSSSSSSATQTDWKASLTMVDHAVNTDYTLFDKPTVQEIKRPDWKYWKRSHPSSPIRAKDPVFSAAAAERKEPDPK